MEWVMFALGASAVGVVWAMVEIHRAGRRMQDALEKLTRSLQQKSEANNG